MDWRQKISDVGVNRVAKAMNVKYPTVYKYVKPGSSTIPRGKSKELCEVMRLFLTVHEHKRFVQSLSSAMVGV